MLRVFLNFYKISQTYFLLKGSRPEVGSSNIKISGFADVADLNITGIGRINAKGLETNNAKKSTDGIATVLLPSN